MSEEKTTGKEKTPARITRVGAVILSTLNLHERN
jgi:hypothetical protein